MYGVGSSWNRILAEMDTLNPYEEIFLAIYGALAGNCFDWGAAVRLLCMHCVLFIIQNGLFHFFFF